MQPIFSNIYSMGSSCDRLPEPGEVLHLDFRKNTAQHTALDQDRQPQLHTQPEAPETVPDGSQQKPLRLLQWNIERGYQLPQIIQQLRNVDADILSLQEVDVGCERSGWKDTGALIAEALGLNYLFVCEFQELHSDLRDALSQGGGVHGNAILSKFDFVSWDVLEHSHHPIDWSAAPEQQTHPLAAREPRRGRRLTLAADVATPQGQLRVYCCHLEVFCGILSRVWQFADILEDARRHQQQQQKQQQQQHHQQQAPCCQAILGDLNTMAHGIARLSPNYCCDGMRWGSLGSSEAAWWQRHVLAVSDPCPTNRYLLKLGLPHAVAQAAVNPGFFDPFDVDDDFTLDNPKYRLGPFHLMQGKLDWVLLRCCRVVGRAHMGNADFSASDHKWLQVDVLLEQQTAI